MDRRRERRWLRQLEVRYWKRGDTDPYRGIAMNISRTGIFVRSNVVLPSGARVRLEVHHAQTSFVAEAVVVRALKTPSHLQTVRPSGMGMRFLMPSELVEEMLPSMAALEPNERRKVPRDGGNAAPPVDEGFALDDPEIAETASGDDRQAPVAPPLQRTWEDDKPVPVAPRGAASGELPSARRPAESVAPMANRVFSLQYRDRQQFLAVFERDIATGGLFVPSRSPANLDEIVHVEVKVGEKGPVQVQGRVVHSVPAPEGEGGTNLLSGMGLQFTSELAVEQLRGLLDEG